MLQDTGDLSSIGWVRHSQSTYRTSMASRGKNRLAQKIRPDSWSMREVLR